MVENYKIGKEFTANNKDTTEENSLYQPIPPTEPQLKNKNKICQLPYTTD